MKVRIMVRATAPWTVARYGFLIFAIACLGFYSYVSIERTIYQTYESRVFDRAPVRGSAALATNDRTTPTGHVARSSLPLQEVIGRLSIPRLHLSAMVHEGIDGKTLQLAVGHIPATVLPGQAGNVGLAGHRDTFFRGLKDLKTHDEIRFSALRGDFKYEVESIVVVEPDNLGVLATSSENVLTLVTCFPFSYIGNAPKRYIVRARQVLPPPTAATAVE
jgi:sortase A